MIQIPVAALNDQVLELTLTGEVFFLQLSWNDTCQLWTASITDAGENTVMTGYAINPNQPLFWPVRDTDMPAGLLLAIPPDRRDTISFNDLVTGAVPLLYGDASDVTDG